MIKCRSGADLQKAQKMTSISSIRLKSWSIVAIFRKFLLFVQAGCICNEVCGFSAKRWNWRRVSLTGIIGTRLITITISASFMKANEITRRCKILLFCSCGPLFSAIALAQTTISFTEGDTARADSYVEKGNNLAFYAKYDSANFYYERAGAIFFEVASETEKTSLWQKYVACYNRMGDIFRIKDRHKEAVVHLNKALEIGTAKLGQNHFEVAVAYDNIGRVYWYKGEVDSALYFCTHALDIRHRVLEENHPDVARSYESMGLILLYNDRNAEAQAYLRKSLMIRRQRFGENSLPVASSYHALARHSYFTKNIDELYNFANKSLAIKRRFFDENHPEIADTYNDVGNYYYYTNNYAKAIEYYDKARVINQQAYGYYHQYVAPVLM